MLKPQQLHFSWNWQLSSSPEELWPLLADTNRLFKDVKFPAVQPTDISYQVDKNHLQLSYNGINNYDAWIEEPYQWEYPFRYGVKRQYKSGSYKQLKLQVDLFPNPKGTHLQFRIWVSPRNYVISWFSILKLKTIMRSRFKSAIRSYDELAGEGLAPYQLESSKYFVKGARKKMDSITDALLEADCDREIVYRLMDFVKRGENIDMQRIQPFKLADHWETSRDDTLFVFLHAVKEGLLNFSWDLYCPDCRTIQEHCKTLNEIHEPVFCHDCNSEFNVNFNRSVQLSFRPNPLIRKVTDDSYCLGGPHSKPHVSIQQYLKPDQKRYVKTRLEEGIYHLYASNSNGYAVLKVSENGQDTVNVRLTPLGLDGEVEITGDPNLIFENRTGKDQVFTLEKAQWDDSAVTAAQATSLQVFRDLFDQEVLRKGEKIAVDKLTLMFTDLLDSTNMYHKEGDDQAVGRVIEHFEILQEAVAKEGGALVKTIGDSIMAVFSEPDKAIRAFLNAQKVISNDKRYGKSLKLKAGIHHGSCVAVNLNNKIDYFGTTVNVASRLVDQADESEVVISESVSGYDNVKLVFNGQLDDFTVKEERTMLKGFDNQQFLIKRIALEPSALRLVI